jgi:aminoglycoside phosphotransferase (APT) family kinase protein
MATSLVEAPTELLTELRRARSGDGDQLGAVVAELGLTPIAGGMQNHLYRWTTPHGTEAVIKLYTKTDRHRVEREWAALNLLAPHQLTTVPAPLWRGPAPAEPAIGMTLLHGTPLLDSTDLPAAMKELAHTTARLHAVPISGLLADLPRVDSGEHYLKRLTKAWPDLLAEQPDDHLTPAVNQLLTTWQNSGDAGLLAEPDEPILSRGDANLLNWLRTDTGAAACVDFEYAGFSNRPFDAADLVEHISGQAVPDDIWTTLLPDLGITDTNRRRFTANQRTCAMR